MPSLLICSLFPLQKLSGGAENRFLFRLDVWFNLSLNAGLVLECSAAFLDMFVAVFVCFILCYVRGVFFFPPAVFNDFFLNVLAAFSIVPVLCAVYFICAFACRFGAHLGERWDRS